MICSYCKQEKKRSKEHIISKSVLDLFPECFLTIDNNRGRTYPADPLINDVCPECNNEKLSYIDAYAKELINNYGTKTYTENEALHFEYDYTLFQKVLLKYSYNDMRSHNNDTSFFNAHTLKFLLDKDYSTPLNNVTILAGLAVNTSPVHDFFFGNVKIKWGASPVLLTDSLIDYIDYHDYTYILREHNSEHNFENLDFSYLFRFNSVQYLILCWSDNISPNKLFNNIKKLQHTYPYTLLNECGNCVLTRCTSEFTYHNSMMIDVIWGQAMFDEITTMRKLALPNAEKYISDLNTHFDTLDKKLAQKHPRH